MKWDFDEPRIGDGVRVKLGDIYHYGIYVGEDEIIQFGLAPNARCEVKPEDICVCVSDVETFLQGGFLERGIAERKDGKKRSGEQVVEYAKSQLGKKGYHILHNNCEHFVYQCLFGQKKSTQTDAIRQFFSSLPIADVYTAKIPAQVAITEVYPKERNNEIQAVSNALVKEERYYAWKLLEYALERTFGYKMQSLEFTKCENGKWCCDKCWFSISHSNSVVAVAVSKKPIGVDIEIIQPPKSEVITRVLTKNELKEYNQSEDKTRYLVTAWSKKESIYKKESKGKFLPGKIETAKKNVDVKYVMFHGEEYALTTSSEWAKSIRYFENIQLT